MPWLRHLVAMMLLASISAADAAPLVPPSDLPGRERYRFALAARPLHAADPARQAAVALGLRPAPRMGLNPAVQASSGLLKAGRAARPSSHEAVTPPA